MADKIEFWSGGDVRSRNIGPAAGDHFLGRVEGPGLYMWIGPNTGGKSHHLRLIGKLQKERLLRSDADITDGADVGYIELGAARMAFRRLPTGEIVEPTRTGIESLPPIEELPTPIETLITGANLKGKEPRARARLEALLTYAPIASTEDLVRQLLAVLNERSFSSDPGAERRDLWWKLAERAKGEKGRTKIERFHTSDEILAAILSHPREGILDDHDRLIDLLNGIANTGEKVAEQQERTVSEAAGRLKETLSAAAKRLGVPDDGVLMSRLRERLSRPEPSAGALSAARVRVAQLTAEKKRQREEEDRRDDLRAKHGSCPDAGPTAALYAAAREAHDRLQSSLFEVRASVTRAHQDLADKSALVKPAAEAIQERRDAWESQVVAFRLSINDGLPVDEIAVAGDLLGRRVDEVVAALSGSASAFAERDRAAAAVVAAEAKVSEIESSLGQARQAMLAREAELDGMKATVAAWQQTDVLLGTPIPGPTDEEIAAADSAVQEADADAETWRAAQDFQRAAAAHDAEMVLAQWFGGVAADLRGAAADSWQFLGQIVTDTLSLPWLMVEGTRLLLAYEGKGSNARLAATPEAAKDVRDVDDADRISTAELHEAMLKLMLSRRERLGGILIVPWQVMAALDERRLGVFSGWSRAAGLVTFSERPRRKGDPDDLVLEPVEPIAESGAVADV